MRKTLAFGVVVVLGGAILQGAEQAAPRASQGTQIVTLIGCVELEADYRKRINAGRGGALGSGAGVANEYVLTEAKPAGEGASGAAAAGGGRTYSITGRLESELKRSIGRQVEVVGFLENPQSLSAASQEVDDLPRVKVNVWHPVGDFCPAKK
jgi:hypothetical protein